MNTKLFRAEATAHIYGNELAPRLRGTVRFYETPYGVLVDAKINGLPQNKTGFFGFHIHEVGKCTPSDFTDAKGHYNPNKTQHPLHAGDMPVLLKTEYGDAWLSFLTTRFYLNDIIGRSVVIHSQRDDYTSQPAGDSGPRIACGIIRFKS